MVLLIGVQQVIEHTVTTAPALLREAAGAPEAPAMAASVGALYRPGDVFLSGPPLDVPIMYYTPAAAQRVFVDSPVYARRLLVLVPTPPDDSASIAQYLAGRVPPHYRPTPETPAQLLQRFPHGVLYQLLRSRPGPPIRISLP